MANYFPRRNLLLFIGALVILTIVGYKADLKFTVRLDSNFEGDIVFGNNKLDITTTRQQLQKDQIIVQRSSKIKTFAAQPQFVVHNNSDHGYKAIIDEVNLSNEKGRSKGNISGWKDDALLTEQEKLESASNYAYSDLLSPCVKPIKFRHDLDTYAHWIKFQKALKDYSLFHSQQIEKIKSGDSTVRTLTFVCYDPAKCHGVGDQMYMILQSLLLAVASNRIVLLDWDKVSLQTFQHLTPNQIQWNFKQVGNDAYNHIRKKKSENFDFLMRNVNDDTQKHVQVSSVLLVPFAKGLNRLLAADKNKSFSKLALRELMRSKTYKVSHSLIASELLRYLFTFSQKVISKVNEAQKIMGLYNKAYIGVHIRTGFYGTQYEEIGKFSKVKMFRTENTWYSTLNCSLALAQNSITQMPLFLATDSYLVKQLASKEFGGNRVRSLNMTLQHVAIPFKEREDSKYVHTLSGVDGFMATWIDFLLLARSEVLVRSTSGFSTLAGLYCSVGRQYFAPKCTRLPSPKYNQ